MLPSASVSVMPSGVGRQATGNVCSASGCRHSAEALKRKALVLATASSLSCTLQTALPSPMAASCHSPFSASGSSNGSELPKALLHNTLITTPVRLARRKARVR